MRCFAMGSILAGVVRRAFQATWQNDGMLTNAVPGAKGMGTQALGKLSCRRLRGKAAGLPVLMGVQDGSNRVGQVLDLELGDIAVCTRAFDMLFIRVAGQRRMNDDRE